MAADPIEAIAAVGTTAIVVMLIALLTWLALRQRRVWPAALAVALVLAGVGISPWLPAGATWDGGLQVAGYALAFVAYPDGRVRPRWLLLPLVPMLVWSLAFAVVVRAEDGVVPLPAQLANLAVLCFAPVLVIRYRRRLSTVEREQVRWALLGAIVTFIGMPTLVLASFAANTTVSQLGPVALMLASSLVLAGPVGLALGLLRPRLAPVDVALFRTIQGAICALPLACGVGLVTRFLPNPSGAWVAALLTPILAFPLWRLGGRLSSAFVFHGRLSPEAAAKLIRHALASEHRAEDAPQLLADTVRAALGTKAAKVTGDGLRSATAGEPDATIVASVPVCYAGEAIAELEIAPRPAESNLTKTDLAIVENLATRAAPALHAARTVTALVDARAALVIAHEEERKRLRRDLHDDLAPTLVGLRLTATGLARILQARSSSDAAEIRASTALIGDVEAAIAQTRALAHGLLPPVLANRGLIAAVRDRARSDDELHIEIYAPDEPLILPAAVEVAVLRIVQESVTNVRRHARASHCIVRIVRNSHSLTVQIEDDGRGLPREVGAGIGLGSLRLRVQELGGALRLDTSPQGGTQVRADLPVPYEEDP